MANSDLKTVGLSFKADGAVDFRKSLTDVNNAVNENRSGVDTSAVMAGLKKALVNASKEGKSMKNALSELQDTLSVDT